MKNQEKVFPFRDNCVSTCCWKFFILRREYLSSAVNVLAKSLKTSDMTKENFSSYIYLEFARKKVNSGAVLI